MLKSIKIAAVDAVESTDPCKVMYGRVTGESPITVRVEDRLVLQEKQLVFWVGTGLLKIGDMVLLIRVQGGQQFVVIGRVEDSWGVPAGMLFRAVTATNLRHLPTDGARRLAQLSVGAVVSPTQDNTMNPDSFWMKVNYNGVIGWIPTGNLERVEKFFVGGLVTGRNVNIRSLPSASSSSQVLGTVTNGDKIRIALPGEAQTEASTTFVKIHHGSSLAWISNGSLFPDYPVEYVPPATVIGVHNGAAKTLSPKTKWWMIGGGETYKGKPLKENGRYRVAVGPKILRPNYSDDGRVLADDFNGFNKNIKVILEHKTTKVQKELLCVIKDTKTHTFNKIPRDTGATASFDVDSGYVQTGIRYPDAAFGRTIAPENMDSSVVEFCTDLPLDFAGDDYELVKVVALE
jgi:hypothetical protein